MTGALRISGKATYVWNYKQCTKYWPLVQNVGSLSSRTSQGPISTLTGSLESHSRTHINRATKDTPMRLLFYLSGCGACVFSLSWWNRWIPTTLLKLGRYSLFLSALMSGTWLEFGCVTGRKQDSHLDVPAELSISVSAELLSGFPSTNSQIFFT